MLKIKACLLLFGLLAAGSARAGDYPASLFGIKSDGSTLNTRSIQYAIDFIGRQGGGRLVFNVGKYLTGTIHLKTNVGLVLDEGAVLLGSLNPFDYEKEIYTALILAEKQQNISISGKGMIEGQGRQVAANIISLIHAGIINDPLLHDRPAEGNRPMLIYFRECSAVTIEDVTLSNSSSWVQTYDQCKDLLIKNIRVDSKAYWNNDGIDIVDCEKVTVTGCFVDAADDGICLKSHDATKFCANILIRDCTIRSSANGIKFGTASYGGFTHIHILHNRVFDTYRSALALEAVDGGYIDNIVVDSLEARNTGNALFLRIGDRTATKKSRMSQIRISNLDVYIAPGKADSGYAYEGPVEDQPRNTSPIIIAGLPSMEIEQIFLTNVYVSYPGGGNQHIASRTLKEIESIPELPAKYPEFSMFRELPAWGIFIRHARNIQVEQLKLSCLKKDYRTAIVLDDVRQALFTDPKIKEPSPKQFFYSNNCQGISVH